MLEFKNKAAFEACVKDLLSASSVQEMGHIPQHTKSISCLDHSIFVAYLSFLICRRFHLDYKAGARGGLLHDLFLYNWRDKEHEGHHLFRHPQIALKNASECFELTEKEKDCIVKHMWPVTKTLPKYRESFVVGCADKICASIEMLRLFRLLGVKRKLCASV